MKKHLIYILVSFGLLSCNSDYIDPVPEVEDLQLTSFSFLNYDNPAQLISDVKGEIIGDSIVDCWVPNIMSDKLLIPQVKYTGERIKFDDIPVNLGSTPHDFKKPVKMTIASSSQSKDYTVYVHSYTGLPVMWIETEGRENITSKEEYLRASFKLVEDVRTRAAGDIVEDSVSIKGRGNTTWGMPKKPYRLKLDHRQSLLDEPEDKSWVLLSNYADKTMIRTSVAFYMGTLSCLEYTPRSHFVELILNGRYEGTYLLCEKLKIGKDRVDVGDDGFLLEIDGKISPDETDARSFYVYHLSQTVNIRDPEVEIDDDNFRYAREFVTVADSVLYSDHFTDPVEGWQKYMDIDSFADWYLINEITLNTDANLYSSCYLNLKRGGKLKMGPLWDFDISLGNVDYNKNSLPTGFWIKGSPWHHRLFKDPAFVAKVKERFNYFYSKKDAIMREINENANYLKHAVDENENRWHTFYTYTWPNYNVWGSYGNEVSSMKEWLNARFEWLKQEFDRM